jgi:hypothetical protein
VLLLAACSGAGAAPSSDVATLVDPSASPDVNASPSASLDPEAAMDAFAQCMRDHGISIQVGSAGNGKLGTGPTTHSDSGSGGPVTGKGNTDADRKKFDDANKACASLLPKGGLNGTGQPMSKEIQDKLLAFSQCMRDHGIDMPDPKFENGGATVQIGGEGDNGQKIDPQSKTFQDAQKACETLLPDKGQPVGGSDGGPATVTQP